MYSKIIVLPIFSFSNVIRCDLGCYVDFQFLGFENGKWGFFILGFENGKWGSKYCNLPPQGVYSCQKIGTTPVKKSKKKDRYIYI